MATLAERLSEALNDRDLTNVELCEMLAEQGSTVTPAYISTMCTGKKKNPNIDLLKAMAALLDVSSGWLMGDDVPRARISSLPTDIPSVGDVTADYALLSPASQQAIAHTLRMMRRAEAGHARRTSAARPYALTRNEAVRAVKGSHPFPALEVDQACARPQLGNSLGQRLRNLRDTAQLEVSEVAALLGTTGPAIDEIESGKRAVSEEELELLLTRYGVTSSAERSLVMEVARGEHDGEWWLDIFGVMPLWLATMLAAESSADVIRCYAADGVPALLQTEAYARAARQAAHHPDPAVDQVDMAVRLIMERQVGPIDQQTAKVWMILREAALLDMPGDPDVQVEQLNHLIDLAKRPNIALRINRLHGGRYRPRGGSFAILQGSGPTPNKVYVTGLIKDELITDPTLADEYRVAHIRLDMSAEPDERTVDMLTEIRKRIAGW
ncbi:Scr1 family TA system antitoxin-like transcriptional regulator [Nonomuraea jabiensis]|uniref:helix-turn-helix domain-containing protein n=1 Tax=Nonomuraea jabiensis TaxID=882448 RepID=UPI003D721827